MKTLGIAFLAFASANALGQSINIELGNIGSLPEWHYAAAASAGYWNGIGITAGFERVNLSGLDGLPVAARYYQYGLSQMLDFNVPSTSGNDEALMDDMALSFCSPVDGCVWVENLLNGNYEVVIYAMTPNDPFRLSPTRVDDGAPGPTWIGGSWPGAHLQGTTFSRHRVTVFNGRIGLHSGTYGGAFQAGMNGIQLTYLDGPAITCYAEDVSTAPGPIVSGSLATIRVSDDFRYSILCDEGAPNAMLTLDGRSPTLDPSSIEISLESRSTHGAVLVLADAYNFQSQSFQNIGSFQTSILDTTRNFSLPANVADFVGPETGALRARFRFVPFQDLDAMDGWTNDVDRFVWSVAP